MTEPSPPPTDAPGREFTILLVEDDDVDAMAVRRIFRKMVGSSAVHLHRAHDGEEGLAELRSLTAKGIGPLIVLLDINMPRLNGHEFLSMMRTDPDIGATTVFVLTTSEDPDDVRLAYDKHVAGYLTKSGGVGPDVAVGKLIIDYAETVVFPSPRSGNEPTLALPG